MRYLSVSLPIYFFSFVVFKEQLGGDEGNRTLGLLLARQALSHLSYTPILLPKAMLNPTGELVGLAGLEPATSRLSGVRSNHLSYRPKNPGKKSLRTKQ